jgi:hypothetical protein
MKIRKSDFSQILQRRVQTWTPGYTRGGIRWLGGVHIPTNTDPWTHQVWDQVPRSTHPYKHGPLDTPGVGSGA